MLKTLVVQEYFSLYESSKIWIGAFSGEEYVIKSNE